MGPKGFWFIKLRKHTRSAWPVLELSERRSSTWVTAPLHTPPPHIIDQRKCSYI